MAPDPGNGLVTLQRTEGHEASRAPFWVATGYLPAEQCPRGPQPLPCGAMAVCPLPCRPQFPSLSGEGTLDEPFQGPVWLSWDALCFIFPPVPGDSLGGSFTKEVRASTRGPGSPDRTAAKNGRDASGLCAGIGSPGASRQSRPRVGPQGNRCQRGSAWRGLAPEWALPLLASAKGP